MQNLPTIQRPTDWSAAHLFVENALCFNTRRDYAAETRLFASWVGKTAADVTLADLLAYRQHLEGMALKPATVLKKLTVLRRLFAFLHEQGFLPRNPAAGLKVPRVRDEAGKDILSLTECHLLLEAIDPRTLRGKRDKAICALLLVNALRTCEVVRANVGDLRNADGYWVMRVHGKGGKEADTRIRDDVYAAIRAYLDCRGESEADEPLFLGTNHRAGSRLTTRTVQHMVMKYLRNIGVERPGLTVHSLRHSAVTFVILAGASMTKAQDFARHSSINTTQRYFHDLERMKDHAVLLHPIQISKE